MDNLRKDRLRRITALILAAWALAACGGQPTPEPPAAATAVAQPTATAAPTRAATNPAPTPTAAATVESADTPPPSPEATTLPSPTPMEAPTSLPVAVFGQTAEGLYFRGSPDPAALTVVDYSDFL